MTEAFPDEKFQPDATQQELLVTEQALPPVAHDVDTRTMGRARFVPLMPALLGEFGDITATKQPRPVRRREELPRPPIRPRQGDESPTRRPSRHQPRRKGTSKIKP